MKTFLKHLLPHEWFFGLFLVVHFLRLVIQAGPFHPDSLIYAGLITGMVSIIAWCIRAESDRRWFLRLSFFPVAMTLVFFSMQRSVLTVSPEKSDVALAAVDQELFGGILSDLAEPLNHPVTTEILSFCYLLFFPYLFFAWFYYARRGMADLRAFSSGLFTVYGIGFLGYSLIPAGGPHLAFPEIFETPLVGGPITRLNHWIVAHGSNGVDVFPSLHCGVSFFILFFDRLRSPLRFRVMLLPCIGITAATIYLRYHYFIDLAAGFALAAFALWISSPRFTARQALPHPTLPVHE